MTRFGSAEGQILIDRAQLKTHAARFLLAPKKVFRPVGPHRDGMRSRSVLNRKQINSTDRNSICRGLLVYDFKHSNLHSLPPLYRLPDLCNFAILFGKILEHQFHLKKNKLIMLTPLIKDLIWLWWWWLAGLSCRTVQQ